MDLPPHDDTIDCQGIRIPFVPAPARSYRTWPMTAPRVLVASGMKDEVP